MDLKRRRDIQNRLILAGALCLMLSGIWARYGMPPWQWVIFWLFLAGMCWGLAKFFYVPFWAGRKKFTVPMKEDSHELTVVTDENKALLPEELTPLDEQKQR